MSIANWEMVGGGLGREAEISIRANLLLACGLAIMGEAAGFSVSHAGRVPPGMMLSSSSQSVRLQSHLSSRHKLLWLSCLKHQILFLGRIRKHLKSASDEGIISASLSAKTSPVIARAGSSCRPCYRMASDSPISSCHCPLSHQQVQAIHRPGIRGGARLKGAGLARWNRLPSHGIVWQVIPCAWRQLFPACCSSPRASEKSRLKIPSAGFSMIREFRELRGAGLRWV